jgi:hypothetical protein
MNWNVQYVSGITNANPPPSCTALPEGQIMVVATAQSGVKLDDHDAETAICQLLHSHSEIFSMKQLAPFRGGVFRVIVEYCDAGAAHRAVTRLTGMAIEVRRPMAILLAVSANP